VRTVVLLVVVCACGFEHGAISHDSQIDTGSGSGSNIDAAVDAPADAKITNATCDTSGLTCAGTTVALMCNGACWVKCTQTVAVPSQLAASGACNGWGGELAPIRDANDQACVSQMLFPSQASWTGFEQSITSTTLSGGWSWNSDGVVPTFVNWDPGQPNDFNGVENGQEQCAYMTTSGGWQDTDCFSAASYRFSCRRSL